MAELPPQQTLAEQLLSDWGKRWERGQVNQSKLMSLSHFHRNANLILETKLLQLHYTKLWSSDSD